MNTFLKYHKAIIAELAQEVAQGCDVSTINALANVSTVAANVLDSNYALHTATCIARINALCDEDYDECGPVFSEYTHESASCADAVREAFPSTHSVCELVEVVNAGGVVVLRAAVEF